MQDDSSVILFASNVSTCPSPKTKLRQANSDGSDRGVRTNIRNLFKLVAAYTNLEILAHLREFGARMVVFHFQGSSDSWQSLRAICQHSSVGALPTYLGKQKHLRVVFLSGCATDNFIEDLLNAGVPAVVSSTDRLTVEQTELFAECVEGQLNAGLSLYESIEAGKLELQTIVGEKQRVFVNFRYDPTARIYGPLPPHIYGEPSNNGNGANGYQNHNKPQTGGIGSKPPNPPTTHQLFENSEPSSRPPRNWKRPHPFVGNRPFSRDDADIFFGRDSEVSDLVKFVKGASTQPFILLSGAAGCGKTSLIQAGLLVALKNEFEVIKVSAESTPELVSVLRNELTTRTGRENLLEAWQTLEGNYDAVKNMTERRVLLIIDNIDSIINSQHPRDRREIRNLLHALLPVYAHTLFRSHSKILLSARCSEARDIWLLLREIGLPTVEMPLRTMSATGLAQAIRMPFAEASPGNIQLSEEVARRIEHELLIVYGTLLIAS